MWEAKDKPPSTLIKLIGQLDAAGDEFRLVVAEQNRHGVNALLDTNYSAALAPHFESVRRDLMVSMAATSSWHMNMQLALGNAATTDPSPADAVRVEGHDKAAEITITPYGADNLALQVKPGSTVEPGLT